MCFWSSQCRSLSPSSGGYSCSDVQRKSINEYNRSIKTNQPWNVQQTSQIDVVQHCERTSPYVCWKTAETFLFDKKAGITFHNSFYTVYNNDEWNVFSDHILPALSVQLEYVSNFIWSRRVGKVWTHLMWGLSDKSRPHAHESHAEGKSFLLPGGAVIWMKKLLQFEFVWSLL